MKKMLELKNITKKFGCIEVIKETNLTIEEKDIIGIIGRNGSGKTVLLKIISGLYAPTTGSIEFFGDVTNNNIGVLIDTGFLPNKTGIQNLELISNLCQNVTKKDCYNLLELVGLDPFSIIKYRNYSTGMKQRLALAQSIMDNPKFIILDEPFNGIDKETVKKFRELISYLREKGKTIIITSHYQEDINLLCDKVYEMDKGILIEVLDEKE